MDTKDQLTGYRFELSKSVLYLSALGLFAKLLNADVVGANALLPGFLFKPEHVIWAAGVVGIVQTFTVFALHVCILEGLVYGHISGSLKKDSDQILRSSRSALLVFTVVKGFGGLVYFLPVLFGTFVAIKLWPDTAAALGALWRVL